MPGLLTALLLTAALAPGDDEVLAQAEAAFREGVRLRDRPAEARALFNKAAERYELLRRRGHHNADVDRNLGHAYLLAGDLPRAILAYRRGLRLAPHDAELRARLEYARDQVVYSAHGALGRPRADLWPPWLPRPSPRTCLWMAAAAYGLGWLAVARWFMVRRSWLLVAPGVAFGAALLPTAVVLVHEMTVRDELRRPVVVVAEEGVLLRRGNGLNYPPRAEAPLNRGVEARLLFTKGDWLQIELAGGEVGWVPRAYALVDEQP